MTQKIEEHVFVTVIRYDAARSLFDSIVAMDGVAQVYPEYEADILKLRDDMWRVLLNIAKDELENVDKIESTLKQMSFK